MGFRQLVLCLRWLRRKCICLLEIFCCQ